MKIYKIATSLFIVFNFIYFNNAIAQSKGKPTVKELQQMAEEMKKKIAAGENMDEKKLKEMAKKFGEAVKSGKVTTPGPNDFPKVYLGNLPKKALVGDELTTYIQSLQKKAMVKLEKDDKELVAEAVKISENDAAKLGKLSVYTFYKGGVPAGLVMAMKAALMDVANDLNVNNLGGMLITAGAPAQAIPIFRGLVFRNPKSSMILNNMAQAFAGVGLKDSAMVYIGRCLKRDPKHAQANNTAAQIAKSNGNTAKAVEYARKSVEGGLNEGAMDLIDKYDKTGTAYDFFAKSNDIPDYFNLYKFKKPSHQLKVEDAQKVLAEQFVFENQISKALLELGELQNEEQRKGEQQLDAKVKSEYAKTMATGKAPAKLISPMVVRASRILPNKYIQIELPKKIRLAEENYTKEIALERSMLELDLKKIDAKFQEMMAPYNCGEGRGTDCLMIEKLTKQCCKEKNERINIYLQSCAMIADRFDKIQMNSAREIFHFNSKWKYLVGVNEHMANALYYHEAMEYLKAIKKVVGYKIVAPVCDNIDKFSLKSSDLAKFQYACPINLDMEFGIASLKANCKTLSWTVKAPEFVKFNYEKNFETGQSTLSLIAFLDGDIGIGNSKGTDLGIRAGVSAEAFEAFYITFDKNNSFADAGIKMGASVSIFASSGVSGEAATTNIEKGFESGFGINSGFTGAPSGADGIGDSTISSWF